MSSSPSYPLTARGGRAVSAITLLSFSITLVLVVALAGCGGGGKDNEDVVLATVGSKDLTGAYYEERLGKLEKVDLPRGADGAPADMSLQENKEKFLTTMINKEIMVQTATRMGFQNDPKVVTARTTLLSYEAGLILWERAINEPSSTISPEELEAFYEKMGATRKCLYVVTNFLEDAEAAREMALGGADWEDVVAQYHDGMDPPTGVFEISVPFGRYNPEFENGVYNTEIGGITPPIQSVYGYWVLKVVGEKPGKKPGLEEAKAQILDVTHMRKMSHLKDEFKKSVLDKFQMKIHEEALWKCYLALPQGETLFREGTQTPRSQDELAPLAIATEDMDLPFYSYVDREGVLKEFTLLDYKTHFDKMSVFQRPKDTEMLGGLRNKIQVEMEKILLNFEAMDRGLFEDPDVAGKVDLKIEEMIVSRLYQEVITIEERVTLEEIEAFWAENKEKFYVKETRSGRLVVAQNAEQAAAARAKVVEGAEWRDILLDFGTDRENKANSGKLADILATPGDPVATALFALETGAVSEPFAMEDGRFGIVRLDAVVPGSPRQMDEVTEAIGMSIREVRKEEAFQAKLAEWKETIPVTTYPEKLAEMASWEELRTVQLPENLVPRN